MLECLEENFKMIKICAKQNERGRQRIIRIMGHSGSILNGNIKCLYPTLWNCMATSSTVRAVDLWLSSNRLEVIK